MKNAVNNNTTLSKISFQVWRSINSEKADNDNNKAIITEKNKLVFVLTTNILNMEYNKTARYEILQCLGGLLF